MGNFLRRLKYYGIGFGLGTVIVLFLLPNRSCSWTPSNRIKNTILSRLITINEAERAVLQAKKFSEADLLSVLNDGQIDFKASRKEGDTKVYVIQKKIPQKGTIRIAFTLPEDSFISEVNLSEQDSEKIQNTTVGWGYFLSFPNDDYLVYPDSTAKIACQMKELDITSVKQIYTNIKKTGRINFAKTNFANNPKPQHTLEFTHNKEFILMQATWYKNKIFVSNFSAHTAINCQ